VRLEVLSGAVGSPVEGHVGAQKPEWGPNDDHGRADTVDFHLRRKRKKGEGTNRGAGEDENPLKIGKRGKRKRPEKREIQNTRSPRFGESPKKAENWNPNEDRKNRRFFRAGKACDNRSWLDTCAVSCKSRTKDRGKRKAPSSGKWRG